MHVFAVSPPPYACGNSKHARRMAALLQPDHSQQQQREGALGTRCTPLHAIMDSPGLSSPRSASEDASTTRTSAVHVDGMASKAVFSEDSPMALDDTKENSDSLRKRKQDGDNDDNKRVNSKSKSPERKKQPLLQSGRHTDSVLDIDDDDEVEVVAVSSKPPSKRPKLDDAPAKTPAKDKDSKAASTSSSSTTKAARDALSGSSSNSKSKTATTSTSNAASPATESVAATSTIVQFKNGKLLLKQKKIDFAQQSAALQKRIVWNDFIEQTDESLSEIPKEHHALLALMVHESDRTANDLAKTIKAALNPPLTGEEDSQEEATVDKLPLAVVSKSISLIAERVNHGFRDPPTPSSAEIMTIDSDSDSNEGSKADKGKGKAKTDAGDETAAIRDLPKGYEMVPAGLKLFRWEVKKDMRGELFECLPREMQERIEARVEEREQARDEAKKLLASLSTAEQKEILLKGIKTGKDDGGDAKASTSKDGATSDKKAKASKTSGDGEGSSSSTFKAAAAAAAAAKKSSAKELTEEEKREKEEKKRLKEEEKLEKERKKAEREAAKAEKEEKKLEKEAAKAEKDALKAEKDALKAQKEAVKAAKEDAKRKIEQAQKQQKNAFGAWLAKAGTSPVEALSTPASTSKKPISSASSSERGSVPPLQHNESSKKSNSVEQQSYRDYYTAFRPFFVKPGMEVAPVNRFLGLYGVKKEEELDMQVDVESVEMTKDASLEDFMSRAALNRIPSSSKDDIQTVAALMAAMQEHELQGDMDTYYRLRAQLRSGEKYPLKLLKFSSDVRPGYYGTWTKKSSKVTGRTPFSMDEDVLDYAYDSEAEWDEDPEDAEDINKDSGDEELSGESEDDLDGWLADDDEVEFEAGFEGGVAFAEDDDAEDPFSAGAGPDDKKAAGAKKQKPSVKRKKVTGPLVPIIKGPYWEDEGSEDEGDAEAAGLAKFMEGFRISWLDKNCKIADGTLDPFAFVEKRSKAALTSSIKLVEGGAQPASASTGASDGASASVAGTAAAPAVMTAKKPTLPEAHMPLLTETVLKSTSTTRLKLLEELYAVFYSDRKVTKSMLERAVKQWVAKKKNSGAEGGVWEIVEQQQQPAAVGA